LPAMPLAAYRRHFIVALGRGVQSVARSGAR
jgi:hypothetical protein